MHDDGVLLSEAANKSKILVLASNLRFSWETLASTSSFEESPLHIDEAIKAVYNSQAIIIVGYSFSLYNKVIDSKLEYIAG